MEFFKEKNLLLIKINKYIYKNFIKYLKILLKTIKINFKMNLKKIIFIILNFKIILNDIIKNLKKKIKNIKNLLIEMLFLTFFLHQYN